MRTQPVLLALIVCVRAQGAAQGAAQDSVKNDLARLEGEWTMVSGRIDGESIPKEVREDIRRVAKDGETTVTISGKTLFKAKFSIDPSKKPKTIDYVVTEGPNKGKSHLGIYEFEGDSVKFCYSPPGKDRPSDFTANEGSGRTLSFWKRAK